MNIKKTVITAAAAVALTVPAGLALQQSNQPEQAERHSWSGKRGHGFRHHLFGRAAAELNLTEQQKEFGKQLMTDTRNLTKSIHDELHQVRNELTEAIKANNVAAIDSIAQRQATLMAQLSAAQAKARATFYAQLTPEQKAKADELRAGYQDRASPWMQKK